MAFTVTTSSVSVSNMDSAKSSNLKWAWGLILDSSLSKQATLKAIRYDNTTFLSYLALMQLSWYCNMVWTWDMLDTALPIIRVLCGTKTGQQHWNWTNKYSTVNCWSLPSCYLVADIENNLPVNPSPSLQIHAHTHTPKHTKLETQTQSMHLGYGGEGDWSLWWQKLTMKWWKATVRCGVKRHWELTATLICVCGLSCQRNNTRVSRCDTF